MYRKTIWREKWCESNCDPSMPCRFLPEEEDADCHCFAYCECPFYMDIPKFLLLGRRAQDWYMSAPYEEQRWPRERQEISHPETACRLAVQREHNLDMFSKRTIIRLRERLAHEKDRPRPKFSPSYSVSPWLWDY